MSCPADGIDRMATRGKAQVEAYWYGPLGKKNSSLRVLHAEAIDIDNTRVDYTIVPKLRSRMPSR